MNESTIKPLWPSFFQAELLKYILCLSKKVYTKYKNDDALNKLGVSCEEEEEEGHNQ